MSWPTCRRFVKRAMAGRSLGNAESAEIAEKRSLGIVTAIATMLVMSGVAQAQGLDPAALLQPPADSWPTYHGD